MKTNKLLLISALLLVSPFLWAQEQPEETQELSPEQIRKYKGYAQQMTRIYFSMLNSLGDPENPISEKEVIVNNSFNKIFVDAHVQIEDDLDDQRDVPIHKNVQAYLRDVDFFFKRVSFSFEVQDIEMHETAAGANYIKVTVNRTIDGVSVKDGSEMKNNKVRYIEINIDRVKEELRIASVYSTKINMEAELRQWWNTMSPQWQEILAANVTIEDSISDTQLKSIAAAETLILNDSSITDIEPVSKLISLKQIDISHTQVESLMPLRSILSLEIVKCAHTPVSSIRPLRYAINLKELDIAGSQVTEISDAENFVNLQRLNLSNTQVSNLEVLQYLSQLEDLQLSQLPISKLDALSELGELKFLKLSRTLVMNIGVLSQLKKLQILDLSNTNLNDLSPLGRANTLKTLFIDSTMVSSLSPLNGLNLTHIYCNYTPVSKDKAKIVAFISSNPKTAVIYNTASIQKWWTEAPEALKTQLLKAADLDSAPAIDQLHRIAAIQHLDLSNTEIKKLDALAMLLRLESLDITNTPVTSLSPLSQLSSLQQLRMDSTQISDLTPLAKLSKLTRLHANHTQVSELTPITACYNLQELGVSHTKVTTLEPLIALPSLQSVDADHNAIADTDLFIQKTSATVIYKTKTLREWYNNLPEAWKGVFAQSLKIDTDPSPKQLHKIVAIEEVAFESLPIQSLEPLAELHRLKSLSFSDTHVSSLAPLSKASQLEKLICSQNPIQSLAPISNLVKLTELDCSNTGVTNLSPLAKLVNMRSLKLNANKIRKLDPISQMRQLKELEIYNSEVMRLKPLYGLQKLEVLKCYNTRTSQKRVNKLKAQNRELQIIFYGEREGLTWTKILDIFQ